MHIEKNTIFLTGKNVCRLRYTVHVHGAHEDVIIFNLYFNV